MWGGWAGGRRYVSDHGLNIATAELKWTGLYSPVYRC